MKKFFIFISLFLFLGTTNVFAAVSDGTVTSYQKIGNNTGGFGALSNEYFWGSSVSDIGDLNNDGTIDLAVGAPSDDTGGSNRGAIYILFMNANGTVASSQKIADSTGGFGLLADSDAFGSAVAFIGDLNDDGISDLAVSADGDDTGGAGRGAIYILFMNANGTVASSQKIADNTGGFGVLTNSEGFGSAVASISDLNNDGIIDLAVGAEAYNNYTGAIYILFMNANGTVASSQKIADSTGGLGVLPVWGDFGFAISTVGDLNNDSLTDLVVGAPYDNDTGAIYILFMNANGTVSSYERISSNTGGLGALVDWEGFGYSVSTVGDLNNDGTIDLAVGVIEESTGGFGRGAIYILFMNANGTVASSQKIADNTGGFGVLADSDGFGASVSDIGDLNDDGVTDLTVGATGSDDAGGTNTGAVYVLFMNASNSLPVLSSITPTSATEGDPELTITATGTDFISTSTIDWNGAPLVTTFVSATEITAIVPALNLTTAGTANVTVTSPAPGGGTSDPQVFTIEAAPVVAVPESSPSSSGSRPKARKVLAPVVEVTPVEIEDTCLPGQKYNSQTGQLCTVFTSDTSTLPICNLTMILRQGSRGEQVKCLQSKLNIISDGIFGPMTKNAVILFQKNHNLIQDGIVGPITRGEMDK